VPLRGGKHFFSLSLRERVGVRAIPAKKHSGRGKFRVREIPAGTGILPVIHQRMIYKVCLCPD